MKRTVLEATKDGQVKMEREQLLSNGNFFRDGISGIEVPVWFPLKSERRIAKTANALVRYFHLREEQPGDVIEECSDLKAFDRDDEPLFTLPDFSEFEVRALMLHASHTCVDQPTQPCANALCEHDHEEAARTLIAASNYVRMLATCTSPNVIARSLPKH